MSDSKKMVVTGSDPKSDLSSNPSSNPKIATHTTNINFTQKLLVCPFAPKIITVVI